MEIIIISLIIPLAGLIFLVRQMLVLRRNAKTGNIIDMTVVDGVPNMSEGMLARIFLEDTCVTIRADITKATTKVDYSQITDIGIYMETEIVEIEKKRSVAGRAAVGGLLFGRTGAIIGGMTGLQNPKVKKKEELNLYFIINYTSSKDEEPKVLSFKSGFDTWGLNKFEESFRRRAGLPLREIPEKNTVL